MYKKLKNMAVSLWRWLKNLIRYRNSSRRIDESKFADNNFKGYQCQNCCTFFPKDKFGGQVDRITSVKISKPFIKYSDEYQQHKPEINNPARETTDYCPECSENREDIRKFELIYREENKQ